MDKKKKYFSFSWGIHLLLNIVTLGIWEFIWVYKASKYLNEKTNEEFLKPVANLLLYIFIPVYRIVWFCVYGKSVETLVKQSRYRSKGIHIKTILFSIFFPTIVPFAYMQSKIDYLSDPMRAFTFKRLLAIIKFDKWKGWVYLLPCLILLVVFTGYPIINTVLMAFQNGYDTMDAISGVQFSWGIDNFTKVIDYSGFKTCLFNTIILCVITVPISTILALIIAVCLNSIKFLSRFLQTIYFLPYVTNSIAIGMVFAAMFNMVGSAFGGENELIQSAGIINNILGVFGVDPINWINEGSSQWANIFVISFYIIWNALPFKILILLGGLQSVNKQYYDAAKIDSTPKWRVFSKITVPLLSPMIAYVVITGFIGGFKEYSSIVGILGDDMGPTGAPRQLNTMVGFIYNFIDRQQGRASAAALILFGIILIVTMINLYVSKKKTHF